jgi:hypothetical protein
VTKFIFSLDDPTYLLPHKVGILGLAKVLDYCDRSNLLTPLDIKFSIEPRTLTLNWQCSDIEAFSVLKKEAYQITDGIIDSPSLELSDEERYFFSQGLLSSFFQHNMHRKFTGENRELSFLVEQDKPLLTPSIRLVSDCCYTANMPKLFSRDGAFVPELSIKSHNFPGMIEDEFNLKKNLESIEKFLLLFFLPLVAPIITMSSDLLGARKGLILIEPYNLAIQCKSRIPRSFKSSIHSSYGDAIFSALAQYQIDTQSLDKEIYVLGTQKWNAKQKFIKKKVVRPWVSKESLELFKTFANLLPSHVNVCQKETKKENGDAEQKVFISTSSLLGFIADNLAMGKLWHYNLAQFLLPKPYYEKETLRMMTQEYGTKQYKDVLDFGRSLWENYIRANEVTTSISHHQSLKTRVIYSLSSVKNKDAFMRNFSKLFPSGINYILSLEKDWEIIRDEVLQAIFLYNLPKSNNLNKTGTNDKK